MKYVADTMVAATALGAVVFIVIYLRRNWRASAVGHGVMALMVVIALESTLAVMAAVFGRNWPGRDAIRAVAWGAIAVIVWSAVWLLLHDPRRRFGDRTGRHRTEQPDNHPDNHPDDLADDKGTT